MLTSIVAALMSVLATLTSTAQVEQTVLEQGYANQTPYGNAERSTIKTPPAGYALASRRSAGTGRGRSPARLENGAR
jgi:hypothetical protein